VHTEVIIHVSIEFWELFIHTDDVAILVEETMLRNSLTDDVAVLVFHNVADFEFNAFDLFN
jgi:hypothetical protein